MKKFLLLPVILCMVGCGLSTATDGTFASHSDIAPDFSKIRLESHARTLSEFFKENDTYNTDIAFLIDMKRPSGKYRFFVYDFSKRQIIDSGLVAHGSGSGSHTSGKLKFSNTVNSNCTSLGKYRIAECYYGRFGNAYKLHGLDHSNSNAWVRNIVLHAYKDVPDMAQETEICHSLGCPMVSETFFKRLQVYLDQTSKPIILEIYDE